MIKPANVNKIAFAGFALSISLLIILQGKYDKLLELVQ